VQVYCKQINAVLHLTRTFLLLQMFMQGIYSTIYKYKGGGPVPEIIDPVFAKTSQNARFLLSENERFGLVFVKTGSINSGTGVFAAKGFE
jgi:hypothetical protein